MSVVFLYGTLTQNVNVSRIVLEEMPKRNGTICIPRGDLARSVIFGCDPFPNIEKSVFVMYDNRVYEYPANVDVLVDFENATVKVIAENTDPLLDDAYYRLKRLHQTIRLEGGTMREEFPEQMMSMQYLTGSEKVLEIGGNVGRNSMVIASILNGVGNFDMVVMETDPKTVKILEKNRDQNGFVFSVENAALSKRGLIQKEWDTMVSDVVHPGFFKVETIDYGKLLAKYGIAFDTLVLDCEGAFYYMLMDMPEMLDGIRLILMENDYHDIREKRFVDGQLLEKGFERIYAKAGGWGPCQPNFFEVWRK